jgi:hypothetical protein
MRILTGENAQNLTQMQEHGAPSPLVGEGMRDIAGSVGLDAGEG